MTNFTKEYAALILKKIMQKASSDKKKLANARIKTTALTKTHADTKSMRHWRAAGDIEHYYKMYDDGLRKMGDLHDQTQWHNNLHQDRYSFVTSKYSDVLKDYEDSRYFTQL